MPTKNKWGGATYLSPQERKDKSLANLTRALEKKYYPLPPIKPFPYMNRFGSGDTVT